MMREIGRKYTGLPSVGPYMSGHSFMQRMATYDSLHATCKFVGRAPTNLCSQSFLQQSRQLMIILQEHRQMTARGKWLVSLTRKSIGSGWRYIPC